MRLAICGAKNAYPLDRTHRALRLAAEWLANGLALTPYRP
jgi:hypothetical protein